MISKETKCISDKIVKDYKELIKDKAITTSKFNCDIIINDRVIKCDISKVGNNIIIEFPEDIDIDNLLDISNKSFKIRYKE